MWAIWGWVGTLTKCNPHFPAVLHYWWRYVPCFSFASFSTMFNYDHRSNPEMREATKQTPGNQANRANQANT